VISQKPILLIISGSVIVFAVLWILARLSVGKVPYNMDAHQKPKAFEPHLKRYQDLAKLILALSAATIAFLFNFLASIPDEPEARGAYNRALEDASPFALGFLCLSVFYALSFIFWQTFQYETYEHSEEGETYTGNKYATTVAFGYSCLTLSSWFVLSASCTATLGCSRRSTPHKFLP
jgi:hypothetical protein